MAAPSGGLRTPSEVVAPDGHMLAHADRRKAGQVPCEIDLSDPAHPLHLGRVCEHPKVFFCERNRHYVMWFHADSADYTYAQTGCAVAERPEGPFHFCLPGSPTAAIAGI